MRKTQLIAPLLGCIFMLSCTGNSSETVETGQDETMEEIQEVEAVESPVEDSLSVEEIENTTKEIEASTEKIDNLLKDLEE